MDRGRASSLPPGGNPFWSSLVQSEWNLRSRRPIELPVPGEDAEVALELQEEEEIPIGDGSEGESRRGRERKRAGRNEQFRTPASWMGTDGRNEKNPLAGPSEGMQTAGSLPEHSPEGQEVPAETSEWIGKRTQGPHPADAVNSDVDGLQRSLEQAMWEKLVEENSRLHEELEQLKRSRTDGMGSGATSVWSEVMESRLPQGRCEATPPPPPPAEASDFWQQQRHTPNWNSSTNGSATGTGGNTAVAAGCL